MYVCWTWSSSTQMIRRDRERFKSTWSRHYNIACYCSFVGFDCFYNVLICKSLWIKASAK